MGSDAEAWSEAHYSANITVEKTSRIKERYKEPTTTKDTFRVTVRANTLQQLQKKMVAHLNLIDEEDVSGEG